MGRQAAGSRASNSKQRANAATSAAAAHVAASGGTAVAAASQQHEHQQDLPAVICGSAGAATGCSEAETATTAQTGNGSPEDDAAATAQQLDHRLQHRQQQRQQRQQQQRLNGRKAEALEASEEFPFAPFVNSANGADTAAAAAVPTPTSAIAAASVTAGDAVISGLRGRLSSAMSGARNGLGLPSLCSSRLLQEQQRLQHRHQHREEEEELLLLQHQQQQQQQQDLAALELHQQQGDRAPSPSSEGDVFDSFTLLHTDESHTLSHCAAAAATAAVAGACHPSKPRTCNRLDCPHLAHGSAAAAAAAAGFPCVDRLSASAADTFGEPTDAVLLPEDATIGLPRPHGRAVCCCCNPGGGVTSSSSSSSSSSNNSSSFNVPAPGAQQALCADCCCCCCGDVLKQLLQASFWGGICAAERMRRRIELRVTEAVSSSNSSSSTTGFLVGPSLWSRAALYAVTGTVEGVGPFAVRRRHCDFQWLQQQLQQLLPGVFIPPLPKKQGLGCKGETETAADRRQGLCSFLTRVLNRPHLANTSVVRAWLEVTPSGGSSSCCNSSNSSDGTFSIEALKQRRQHMTELQRLEEQLAEYKRTFASELAAAAGTAAAAGAAAPAAAPAAAVKATSPSSVSPQVPAWGSGPPSPATAATAAAAISAADAGPRMAASKALVSHHLQFLSLLQRHLRRICKLQQEQQGSMEALQAVLLDHRLADPLQQLLQPLLLQQQQQQLSDNGCGTVAAAWGFAAKQQHHQQQEHQKDIRENGPSWSRKSQQQQQQQHQQQQYVDKHSTGCASAVLANQCIQQQKQQQHQQQAALVQGFRISGSDALQDLSSVLFFCGMLCQRQSQQQHLDVLLAAVNRGIEDSECMLNAFNYVEQLQQQQQQLAAATAKLQVELAALRRSPRGCWLQTHLRWKDKAAQVGEQQQRLQQQKMLLQPLQQQVALAQQVLVYVEAPAWAAMRSEALAAAVYGFLTARHSLERRSEAIWEAFCSHAARFHCQQQHLQHLLQQPQQQQAKQQTDAEGRKA